MGFLSHQTVQSLPYGGRPSALGAGMGTWWVGLKVLEHEILHGTVKAGLIHSFF